jgi:phage major head subunit gpT-like protein
MPVQGFDDRNILGLFDIKSYDAFQRSWASAVSFYNGTSDRAAEDYGILGANSEMREWIGARQGQVLRKKSYTIQNAKYESTLAIPKEEVERDKSGLLEARMGTFATDATAGHWETLVESLINNGATDTCYDGAAFFSASHSWGDSGTQKNLLTSSEVSALNVSTVAAPTPVEMARVILGVVGHMLTFKNDKGRFVNGSARNFLIMCPTVNYFSAASQAVGSDMLSDSGTIDNPLKGLGVSGFNFNVTLDSNITDTDAIHVIRTDGDLGAFILQDEQAPELSILGPGSDYYFDNDAYKVGVNARRGAGYGLWEYAANATLS